MKLFRKILYISFWLLLLSGICVTLSFVSKEHGKLRCSNVDVLIDDADNNQFVSREDILRMALDNMDSLNAQTIETIDISKLEKIFNTHPAISNAEVSADISGNIKIQITQRRPIARFINALGESYYMDEKGKLMVWMPNYTARLPVVTGDFYDGFALNNTLDFSRKDINDTLLKKNKLYGLYWLVRYIDSSEFWKAQIQQIVVSKDGLELIPTIGSHRIVFGEAEEIDEKFNKLMIFYSRGLSKIGWNVYSAINLKFKNNVICKK